MLGSWTPGIAEARPATARRRVVRESCILAVGLVGDVGVVEVGKLKNVCTGEWNGRPAVWKRQKWERKMGLFGSGLEDWLEERDIRHKLAMACSRLYTSSQGRAHTHPICLMLPCYATAVTWQQGSLPASSDRSGFGPFQCTCIGRFRTSGCVSAGLCC